MRDDFADALAAAVEVQQVTVLLHTQAGGSPSQFRHVPQGDHRDGVLKELGKGWWRTKSSDG